VDLRLVPSVQIDLVREEPDVGRELADRAQRCPLRDLQRGRKPLRRQMLGD
jgi:hypothetical protein